MSSPWTRIRTDLCDIMAPKNSAGMVPSLEPMHHKNTYSGYVMNVPLEMSTCGSPPRVHFTWRIHSTTSQYQVQWVFFPIRTYAHTHEKYVLSRVKDQREQNATILNTYYSEFCQHGLSPKSHNTDNLPSVRLSLQHRKVKPWLRELSHAQLFRSMGLGRIQLSGRDPEPHLGKQNN